MATRRSPSDPVDPFASLPLGQTLSGERERERDAARRALDASLGRNLAPDSLLGRVLADGPATVSEQAIRTAETIAALRETPSEARQSADLAALQRRIAAEAEEARRRSMREARDRTRRQEAERVSRYEQIRQERTRIEEARQRLEEARQSRLTEDAREQQAAQAQTGLDAPHDARTLLALEAKLQRHLEAVQRSLTSLTEELATVREQLAKKAPAPTGNEEAPFREGERHLDLGGDK